ncbi:hypothetical protein [Flavobacterium sp. UBA4854]|uniref:hypothetical protein n=1 Tax=Flavobacterium sp. UBA4854 TaxID=1946548 RepID=UPI00257ACB5F|nr:hypothetical protein [Flavobacterium sp. UBA4854]
MRSLRYSILFLLLIFSFLSCQKERQKPNFKLPNKGEVNAIIKALINSDSLEIAQYLGDEKKVFFCEDLEKLKIGHFDKNKLRKKEDGEFELIEFLIGFPDIPKDKFFFSKSDSLYIEFQSKKLSAFKLEQKDFKEVNIRSVEEIKKEIKSQEYFSYYYATIPILSLNRKKAYLKYVLNCSGLCGAGYRVFLEKKKGKWIVVKYREEWVS